MLPCHHGGIGRVGSHTSVTYCGTCVAPFDRLECGHISRKCWHNSACQLKHTNKHKHSDMQNTQNTMAGKRKWEGGLTPHSTTAPRRAPAHY